MANEQTRFTFHKQYITKNLEMSLFNLQLYNRYST